MDRINNDGDYEPDNVKWSTSEEQARNRRSNILYEYNGELLTLTEISDRSCIPYSVLHKRIRTRGWEPERAFNTAMRKVSKPKKKTDS